MRTDTELWLQSLVSPEVDSNLSAASFNAVLSEKQQGQNPFPRILVHAHTNRPHTLTIPPKVTYLCYATMHGSSYAAWSRSGTGHRYHSGQDNVSSVRKNGGLCWCRIFTETVEWFWYRELYLFKMMDWLQNWKEDRKNSSGYVWEQLFDVKTLRFLS